jgi:diguanylate cyclase (GGDEF)-like protein/PAS domain S-box-containing protein
MAVVSPEDELLEANPALARMLGYEVAELVGTRVHRLLHPDGPSGPVHSALVGSGRDRVRLERKLQHRAGHPVWAQATLTLVRGSDGHPRYTLAVVEDVSERRRLGARLHYQAKHDPLTRLPNRSLFFDRLGEAFAAAGPGGRIGVCYLDLDGFHAVNDTLGHLVGDQLLGAVARRLTERFAPRGHLVARTGGDEFAVVVPRSAGPEELTALATELLELLDVDYELGGQRVSASVSVGVVERAVAGTDPSELVTDADATLHWAKREGRSRWALFDPDRHADQLTRQVLATTMRPALERGEFILDYQPLVRLADGAAVGVESLVRWAHPRFGRLAPDRFIGIAEETGAIVPLGMWVLEESCRQGRRWMREFPDAELFVSVNLAARQIWDSDVVADVAEVLKKTGFPARLLQLELTESAVLGPAGRPVEALHALSAMGIRIAIDDFGTGYSNLSYLSRLPVHALKLDASFVSGFGGPGGSAHTAAAAPGRQEVDAEIVSALVRLAHVLGLSVTAEGVEGPEQARRLRETGCDVAQGWHFARPGPAAAVGAMVARRG